MLLLSKVTQKHFRQPYRPSKVPLRPAGGYASLRSVWLCPVISLPGYIPNHHGKVSPPDTSSGQHPFPSESVPICHPSKSAGIPHSAIRYRSINPMTKCHIFRCCCCNQVFPLSFSCSPFIHLYRKDALKQGSLRSHSPIVSARTFRLHLTVCSLFAIYRCVTRSCRKVVNKNCYHRKLSGMPRLSRYSCRDFSRSSSVEAVFDCVNNCRFAIRSTFSISPLQISSEQL